MGAVLSCVKGGDEVDEGATDVSQLPFLHGELQVLVVRAEDLPDTDTAFFNVDAGDVTDPYVTAALGPAKLLKTKFVANELNPVWNELFVVPVCHRCPELCVKVKDKEHVGAETLGEVYISCERIMKGHKIEEWFKLHGNCDQGRIRLEIQYFPKESKETVDGPDKLVVNNVYSEAVENNQVVLYQDAHTPQLSVFEGMTLASGEPYAAPSAWDDLYRCIEEAQHFIYITGWSVFTEIQLVRSSEDEEINSASTIGELLRRKAESGVKVLLLVWNEKLSTEGSPGLMGTHDEATFSFFADVPNVKCVLVSRAKRKDALASEFVATFYTHHQKTVILDAPIEGEDEKRRLVAFVGGLDITDGRYDTPEFQLWATIGTAHANDFYNNIVPGVTKETGPREPWHDCHAKVEGPGALELMHNFEERWQIQADDHMHHLFRLDSDIFDTNAISSPENPWTVQMFRSITSDSCLFDLDRHHRLHRKGGKLVEDSIMRCLVERIRGAQRFIYMENQYFLGSAYAWQNDNETLSMHVVPQELVERIIEKIALHEPFKVYVLIPMFPEGDPASAAIQEILFWQYRTMQSMYASIARAIKEHNLETRPTDYLNFYCLGKREGTDLELPELSEETPESVRRVHASRRHPVYVHSKMTIVDDEYVLIGSANINQRSMGGNRDTEIAIGAFQPDHINENANGGVHTYRVALWSAHLGGFDESYLDPLSDECLSKVREVTEGFWELYTAEEPQFSQVHMLPYPLRIDDEGRVQALDEPFDKFPDTEASVVGAKSGYLPVKLTT